MTKPGLCYPHAPSTAPGPLSHAGATGASDACPLSPNSLTAFPARCRLPTPKAKIISVHNIYLECVPALHSFLLRSLTLDIALACANESHRISTCIAAIHAPSTLRAPTSPLHPQSSHLTTARPQRRTLARFYPGRQDE